MTKSSQTADSSGRCHRRLSNCAACNGVPDRFSNQFNTLLLTYVTAPDQCREQADDDDLEGSCGMVDAHSGAQRRTIQ